MLFNMHKNFEGKHAPFSASQSSWLRYSDEKLAEVHINKKATEQGTLLHAWAKNTIDLGIKQPEDSRSPYAYLYAYINDAIGFLMNTEVVLFYSENFYGTADAICFRDNTLHIHDLKTGVTPVKMDQLEVYAALFCLEYKIKPMNIDIELRIYQNNKKVIVHKPQAERILEIMKKIIHFDKICRSIDGKEV